MFSNRWTRFLPTSVTTGIGPKMLFNGLIGFGAGGEPVVIGAMANVAVVPGSWKIDAAATATLNATPVAGDLIVAFYTCNSASVALGRAVVPTTVGFKVGDNAVTWPNTSGLGTAPVKSACLTYKLAVGGETSITFTTGTDPRILSFILRGNKPITNCQPVTAQVGISTNAPTLQMRPGAPSSGSNLFGNNKTGTANTSNSAFVAVACFDGSGTYTANQVNNYITNSTSAVIVSPIAWPETDFIGTNATMTGQVFTVPNGVLWGNTWQYGATQDRGAWSAAAGALFELT